MTKKNSSKIISVVHPICCGLDVHKDMVSACIIITAPDGEETFVVQEFSTLETCISTDMVQYPRFWGKITVLKCD